MIKNIRIALLAFSPLLCAHEPVQRLVIFTAPVTDLCLHEKDIANLPNTPAGFAGPSPANIKRSYQALANEQARIVAESDTAYQLAFDNVIYGYDEHDNPLNTFWCPKSAVLVKHTGEQADAAFDAVPTDKDATVILTRPWRNPTSQLLYSAATRFKILSRTPGVHVYHTEIYDTQTGLVISAYIPEPIGIQAHQLSGSALQRFVFAVRQLLESAYPGRIPLVWGGASFCEPRPADAQIEQRDGGWHYPHEGIYSGVDASSFVFRALQIAGVHFPYKTSAAMWHSAPRLKPGEKIEPGCMICYRQQHYGNVIPLMSETTLVRVSPYDFGKGYIEEVKINESLRNASCIAELQELFDSEQPLQFINLKNPIAPENWTIIKPA